MCGLISHTARYAEARAVLDCREMKPEPLSPEEKLRAAKGAETEAETEEAETEAEVKLEYLVEWTDDYENSWEPAGHVSQDLIQIFEEMRK